MQGSVDGQEILESLGVQIASISGEEILCHCPFSENHKNGDRNPSFGFNTRLLVFNCFTCGGGTLLSLVKRLQSLSEEDAEKWIAQQTHHLLDNTSLKETINKKLIKHQEKSTFYPETLINPFMKFHPYLTERGISKDVAKNMKIGYDDLHSGITIPHFFNGKLTGWQTRHLLQDDNGNYVCHACGGKRTPKYTNTPNFPKKNTLYNYSNALYSARIKGRKIIVVESPMTALKLMSEGYDSVVATFGSWSKEQMFSLIGCINGIILWPDNDSAGKENVKRVIEFLADFVPVQIAPILEKEKGDPGDLNQQQLAEYLDNCYNPFLFLTQKRLLNLKEVKMGFQKFGDAEKIVPLDEKEQDVIQSHIAKTGKSVQDFSDSERDSLHSDLDQTINTNN
jgi:DNA primase